MNHELYFLPILARALRSPTPEVAIPEALSEIEWLGERPELRLGWAQFAQLMAQVARCWTVTIEAYCDGSFVGAADLTWDAAPATIEGITPGHYSLISDTGRVLWRGGLSARDVLWHLAFPGKALALAAATGERKRACSREEVIADAGVMLCVYPGTEVGSLGLELL